MTIKELHDNIDCSNEKDIELLKDFIRIPSLNDNHQGISKCVNFLTELLDSCGFFTKTIQTEGNPIIYAEAIVDKDKPTLMFYGHYDVQPTGALNLWKSSPFVPTIKDGRLYGRGTGDGKGQLLINILGVKNYIDTVGKLPVNIKFIIEGEEETGSSSLEKFAKENKDLLKADLVYMADASLALDDTPLVALGSRGVMRLNLEIQTAYADNHSGNIGGGIENASWELIKALASIVDDKGKVLIDGFYDDVLEVSKEDMDMIEQIPFDRVKLAEIFEVKSIDKDALDFFMDSTLRPALSINNISSGYAHFKIDNKIPGRAEAEIEIRMAYNQRPEKIKTLIEDFVSRVNPQIKITPIDNDVLPSRSIIKADNLNSIVDSISKVTTKKPIIVPSWGGSLPSFIWSEILEIPSILVPYANIDENNYGPNENIRIDLFNQGIKITSQIIDDFESIIKS